MSYYEVKVQGHQKHIKSKNINGEWTISRIREYLDRNLCLEMGEKATFDGNFFQLNGDYLMSIKQIK